LFEDVKVVLEKLARTKLLLGTITEGMAVKQAEKILRLGLLKYFHSKAIFISDQIGISKPNVKLYKSALKTVGVQPEQAIYVGDHPVNDIDPPNKLGMITVRINRGGKYAALKGKTQADFEIRTFFDLLDILKRDFRIKID
jgi:putative hydrolase of the HAD superfamily